MLRLFITRHGETEWNVQKILQGRKDSQLTEIGINQAELLAERLKDIEFNKIFSSQSGRAVKTAEIVRGSKEIEIIKAEEIMEMSLGKWEGRRVEETKELYPERFGYFWEQPELYTSDDSETFYDVRDRAVGFLSEITKKHQAGNILIVTHGVTLKVIMAYFEGKNIENLWEGSFMRQTCLNIIEIDENKEAIVRLYGDVSHYQK